MALLLLVGIIPAKGEKNPTPFEYALEQDGGIGLKIDFELLRKQMPSAVQPDGSVNFNITQEQEKLWARVSQEAAAGKEPAVWEIGAFYLNGWGWEPDLAKAEAALRTGLVHQQTHLIRAAVKLARIYLNSPAVTHAGIAQRLLQKLNGCPSGNLAAAESLLALVEKAAPGDPFFQLAKAELLMEQKRYTEAESLLAMALPQLANSPSSAEDRKLIHAYRFLCATRSGNLSAFNPAEFREIIAEPARELGGWIMPVLLAGVLLGLVAFTWRTRPLGPGLLLSGLWIAVAIFGSALGFMVPLPGFNEHFGSWFGAIAVAMAAGLALALLGCRRYFRPSKHWWRTGFQLLGLLVAFRVLTGVYCWFYQQLSGHPLDMQLGALLFRSESWGQLAVVIAVGGLAIAFYEELFFRGFLFDALERRWGSRWSLGMSAAAFGLAHGLDYAPVLFLFGLLLGWLKRERGNLWACFSLHALNNTAAVLILFFKPD